ncbi:YeiH family protein [Neptunicella sp. SCSIO 80796]|uniref:YeiH family protein n=1 Tax=Neptunicella plasticusilytica TaxID=3117012 RepID=UPI003A4E0441
MTAEVALKHRIISLPVSENTLRGVLLVGLIALSAILLAQLPWIADTGLSELSLAIMFGMLFGNTLFSRMVNKTDTGVDFCKQSLLRLGVILYGFRITFQQIAGVGWAGLLIDMLVLGLTFGLALWLGVKLFKLDRKTVILIGAGSSICGAAAILATEPVIRAEANKVSVAVATVVVFGTLSMFLYPLVFPYLSLSEYHYGVWVGSTVHEVAQVIAAGNAISETASNAAIIEKMLRVMLLAPFLMLLSIGQTSNQRGNKAKYSLSKQSIPWFALFFIVTAGLNSLQLLPVLVVKALVQLDTLLLAMAMTALGLRTHISSIKQAGAKPLLLAAILFVFLVVGGFVINLIVSQCNISVCA